MFVVLPSLSFLQQFDPHVVIQPMSNGTCVKVFETHSRVFRNLTSKPRGNTQVGGWVGVTQGSVVCLSLFDTTTAAGGSVMCRCCWLLFLELYHTAAAYPPEMWAQCVRCCLVPQAVFVPSTFSGEPRDFYLGVVHAESNRAYQNYFYKMQVGAETGLGWRWRHA